MKYCLAIDIGGSKIALARIDSSGQISGGIHTQPVPFAPSGSADPRQLVDIIRSFVDQAGHENVPLLGIGLSLCGNVAEDTGEAVLTPNLHWRNLPFGQMLVQACGLPVAAATDVRDAALAEHIWGVAKGARNFAWCTVGTGYGGYLYLDGRLHGGAHGFAGNFGHITLDEANGAMCGCGRRGCFETFVAGPGIARQGQQALDAGASPTLAELSKGQPVTSRMVIQAAQAGDPAAKEIFEQVIRLISINLGGVVNLLDLDMIVMGGGVVHSTPDFVDRIDARIRDFLMTEEAKRDLRVVKESFSNAALYGAAADLFIRQGILE